jgi:hypothetical protein
MLMQMNPFEQFTRLLEDHVGRLFGFFDVAAGPWAAEGAIKALGAIFTLSEKEVCKRLSGPDFGTAIGGFVPFPIGIVDSDAPSRCWTRHSKRMSWPK